MTYFALVYFSWVVGVGIWLLVYCKWRRHRGAVLIGAGAIVQVGAFVLHLVEGRGLRGEPDALYVWIAPLVIAIVGALLWIAGVLRQSCGDRDDVDSTFPITAGD